MCRKSACHCPLNSPQAGKVSHLTRIANETNSFVGLRTKKEVWKMSRFQWTCKEMARVGSSLIACRAYVRYIGVEPG